MGGTANETTLRDESRVFLPDEDEDEVKAVLSLPSEMCVLYCFTLGSAENDIEDRENVV